MDFLVLAQYIILGFIQGFTEPLPISSSGHLAIAQEMMGIDNLGILFAAFANTGSLIAMLVFFWNDLWKILIGFLTWKKHYVRYVLLIICSTIPLVLLTALILISGITIEDSLMIVGLGLIFTGILLFLISYKRPGKKTVSEMSIGDAFIIGCGQAVAILPGVSRSGMTLISSLFVGLDEKTAFKYTFIIYIPASIGAAVLSVLSILTSPVDSEMMVNYLTTFVVAIGATYLGLLVLKSVVKKHKLKFFAIYCWAMGLFVLIFLA